MTYPRFVTGILLMAIVAAEPAAAQSRLAVKLTDYGWNGRTSLFRLPSQALEWTAPERLLNGVFTGTGRYFIGVKEVSRAPLLLQVWVGDVMTGAIWTSDVPGYGGAFVTANPRKDEVYVLFVNNNLEGDLVAVTPAAIRPLRPCWPTGPVVSRDGAVVFCHYEGQLFGVDPESGATLVQHPNGNLAVLATDEHGARVVTVRADGLTIQDTATGDIVQSGPLPLSPGFAYSRTFGHWTTGGRYFVHGRADVNGSTIRETVLVDIGTLSAKQRLPLPPEREVLGIEVSPDARTAYVASTTRASSMIDVIDLPSNRIVFTTNRFSFWPSAFLALTSAPLPPEALQAQVVQRSVRLTWALPAMSDGVSHFLLEAGSRPGRTDVRMQIDGTARELDLADVPHGRYFVRLRAVNATGTSLPTGDMMVEVR